MPRARHKTMASTFAGAASGVASVNLDVFILLLIVFMNSFQTSMCFNLDTRMPVVKLGRNPDSYFGYSVAQHRTLRSREYGQPVLLIGAPQDSNLQPNTTKSGALYQCKLSSDLQVRNSFWSFLLL